MILIGEEIITALKTEFPSINVSEAYSVSAPKCPQITFSEIPSNAGVYLDGNPRVVRNIFTIEVYCKDMTVAGKPTRKRDAAMDLILQVDKFLNKQYGLTMTGNVNAAPYADQTVFRAVANYTAYIDTRTNLVYRGLRNGISY